MLIAPGRHDAVDAAISVFQWRSAASNFIVRDRQRTEHLGQRQPKRRPELRLVQWRTGPTGRARRLVARRARSASCTIVPFQSKSTSRSVMARRFGGGPHRAHGASANSCGPATAASSAAVPTPSSVRVGRRRAQRPARPTPAPARRSPVARPTRQRTAKVARPLGLSIHVQVDHPISAVRFDQHDSALRRPASGRVGRAEAQILGADPERVGVTRPAAVRVPNTESAPCATGSRFIGGLPMKEATKTVFGRGSTVRPARRAARPCPRSPRPPGRPSPSRRSGRG